MDRRALSHDELVKILDIYKNTGECVVPADALDDQVQKIRAITTIIPKDLMREYTFLFTFFEDLMSDSTQQTIRDIDMEGQGVVDYLASTRQLREYGEIGTNHQDDLALLAVSALRSLAAWK